MIDDKWKPKVGEKCIFNDGDETQVLPIFVGEGLVVFKREHDEEELASTIYSFKPIKTSDEIEQVRLVDKALELLGHSRGDDAIVDVLDQLYRGKLLSDKQAEPLSYEDFKEIVETRVSLKFVFNYLASTGFIVKGR